MSRILMMTLLMVSLSYSSAYNQSYLIDLWSSDTSWKVLEIDTPKTDPSDPTSCPRRCECSYLNLRCRGGIRAVQDGCNCCQVCPGQLGEACNRQQVCDTTRDLYCDFRTTTCKAVVRRNCFINNNIYRHGETFRPKCDQLCTCNDHSITCINTCPQEKEKPLTMDGCTKPRFLKRVGDCCKKWVCTDDEDVFASNLYVNDDILAKTKDHSPTVIQRERCMAQVTNWSPCSSTCGVGTSHRINSDNEDCKMRKEIRSCIIRPCLKTKRHRRQKKRSFESCQKTWRPKNRDRIEISGCSSTRMYRPRYCRSCPGMCCRPKVTKTLSIGFRCPPRTPSSNPFTFTKNMMWIKKCQCVPGPCQGASPLRVGRIMGDDIATQ